MKGGSGHGGAKQDNRYIRHNTFLLYRFECEV